MTHTIVILGAGPGLGASIARRFGTDGYDVALVARRTTNLDALRTELAAEGITANTFTADLTDLGQIPDLFQRIRDVHGSIDVLYLGAAPAAGFTPAVELTVETLARFTDIFTYAAVESVRAVLPEMLERGTGSILYANGASALGAPPTMSGPGPALAATRNYLQTLNAEVADKGVYVGALFIGAMIERSEVYTTATEYDPDAFAGFAVANPDDLAEILWQQHDDRADFESVYPARPFR